MNVALSLPMYFILSTKSDYKQTTKSTVCVNYDRLQYSCNSVLWQQVFEIPGKILAHYLTVLRFYSANNSYTNSVL